jgi:hypothetical protein
MYRWWLYVHIASVIGFVLAHGFSAAMGLSIRQHKSSDSIRALTEVSRNSVGISYMFIVLIALTGIALGFQGDWWRFRWIWAAIVVLLLTIGAMSGLANRYNKIRSAAGLDPPGNRRAKSALATPEQLPGLVADANPWPITVIGIVALLVLLWLMILKPF